jgi:hypothetical protein
MKRCLLFNLNNCIFLIGLTSLQDCELCGPGKYQTGLGLPLSDMCTSCGAGTYQTGIGMISVSNCSFCKAGAFQTGYGGIDISTCLLCGSGKFQTGLGMTENGSCLVCTAGTYQTGLGATQCFSCGPGLYQDATGAASGDLCSLCAAGTYQQEYGMTNCTPCNMGFFQSSTGMTYCQKCPAGTFLNKTASASNFSCLPCDLGTSANSSGASVCSECSIGSYQSMTSGLFCLPCEPGSYLNATSGTACKACPSNAWSFPGSDSCICNSGYYHSNAGAAGQGLSTCIDVDECTAGLSSCKASLFLICINTVGSFQCILDANPGLPVCGKPYPASCSVSAGGMVFLNASLLLLEPVNTTVRFGSVANTSLSTIAQISMPWLSFMCPDSVSVKMVTGYVIRPNGETVCSFPFSFVPGPASIQPRTLPLSGGPFLLLLGDYFALFGPVRCTIIYGSVVGEVLQLGPVPAYNTSAPPAGARLMAPLSLECDNQPLLDIGIHMEYVQPPFVTVSGAKCLAFSPCILAVNVTNPPRGILSGNDLHVRLLNVRFDLALDSSAPSSPTVQVGFLSAKLSLLY